MTVPSYEVSPKKNVRQEVCFKFYDSAPMLVEDDGKPHTINLCKNCFNLRLAERDDTKATNAGWKTLIEQKVSRGRLSAAFGEDGFAKAVWQAKKCPNKFMEETTAASVRNSATGGVRHAAASTLEESEPSLTIQDSTDSREANVFRGHAPPQDMCEYLVKALELLPNQKREVTVLWKEAG